MATDTERLQVLVESRVADFEKGMRSVERRMAKMERSMSGDLRNVERTSQRAARTMRQEFDRATSQIEAKFGRFRSVARTAIGGLAGLGVGVGVGAGISGLTRGLADAASTVAALGDHADKVGLTVEQLQALRSEFGKSGVAQKSLDMGMQRFARRIAEASQGTGELSKTIQQLGIPLRDADGQMRPLIDIFGDYAQKIREAENQQEALRLAFKAFDSEGAGMVNLLRQVGSGAKDIANSFNGMPNVFNADDVKRARELDAAFADLSREVDTFVKRTLLELGPGLLQAAEAGWAFVDAMQGMIDKMQESENPAERFIAKLMKFGGAYNLPEAAAGLAGEAFGRTLPTLTEQREKVEELRDRAEEAADRLKSLEDGDAGARAIENAKWHAVFLKRELREAEAALGRLQQDSGAIELPEVVYDQSPSSGGGGIKGTMGAHGQRLVPISTAGGLSAMVNAEHAARFQGLINDLEAQGYAIRSLGGYNNRKIAGTNVLSNHAFGNAIDINPGENPMGSKLITDMPANISELAKKHGLGWGGNWTSKKDAMHFEASGGVSTEREMGRAASEAEKGRAERAAAAERQATALRQVNEQIAQEVEIESQRAAMLQNGFTPEQVNAALDKEALVREKLNQLKAAGLEIDGQLEDRIRGLVDQLWQHREAADAAAASQQNLRQAQLDAAAAAQAIGQPIFDTFMSIVDGSQRAEDAIRSLIKQLANMVLQAAIFGGGPLGNLFGGGLLSGLVPARATGGPAAKGQPYMVGERGRELFVPDQSGRIVDAARTRSLIGDSVSGRTGAGAGGMRARELHVIERPYIAETRVRRDGGLEAFVQEQSSRAARAEGDQVRREIAPRSEAARRQTERRRIQPARGV
ncbi:M15 family metallopeptidase [Acuticoccus sp. M5D2P5]|uniref:M15 family metallopeptidase n=1 Tax=Acuticoccus kalidii TaxID=2910977 RepID=UPI001F3E1E0E|nr:M15 family metallopeptidase [Acuticoccus kalidii]MCF3933303.1 M15 family metallopeptidase [Acuticoccus kalidii]